MAIVKLVCQGCGANLDADSYVWAPDPELYSRSARIIVADAVSADLATAIDTSASFRVKPYHLTRLSDDGARYVALPRTDARGIHAEVSASLGARA